MRSDFTEDVSVRSQGRPANVPKMFFRSGIQGSHNDAFFAVVPES